jgi:dihydroneopterin aldolase
MRMRLEPEHHTLLEELAKRVKQELLSDEARSRLRQIALQEESEPQ